MTDTITLPRALVERALEALTSYCNTGEIDGADDLLFSLLYEVDHADSSFAGKIARDAFIDLARQAGFKIKRFAGPNGEFPVAQMSSGHFVDIGSELATFAKLVIAALKLPQVEQGPVAYYVMNGAALFQLFRSKSQADALAYDLQKRHDLSGSLAHFHVVPLYTHPQPMREPLTDEQIIDIAHEVPVDEISVHEDTWHIRFVRAIERAHKIGGEA